MNSPVESIFFKIIQIDRSANTSIYLQITQLIINSIQRGYLSIGDKLPGTRMIAEHLDVHRNTVVKAFDELAAQAWIEIIPNKGTFVLKQFYNSIAERPYSRSKLIDKYPDETGFSFSKSIILDSIEPSYNSTYFFTDGTADIRLNQFKQLAAQYSATMNRKTTLKNIVNHSNKGNIYFKEQLANYLNQTRGLHIGKDNLLINRSSEMCMYLLSRVLIKNEDIIIVAEWSNPSINMSFLQAGARIMTIPIDENGVQIDKLKLILQKHEIRLIYITPHHHYPSTATLSATRRIELLQLSKAHGFIIIEDDYDYDFHYEKSAILPLASADTNGMVIYTGTFGKSLASSFQTSFVVAPQNLIHELNKYLVILDKQGDQIMEQALGEMIEEGNIHRYLKKSTQVYRQRRDFICQQLDKYFGNNISYKKPTGGLAIWIEFISNISLHKLSLEAIKQNLTIPRKLLFQNNKTTAMRIGFGHMNTEEISETIAILKSCYDKTINEKREA